MVISGLPLLAQEVTGIIKDAQTGEPIPFANIFFAGTTIGSTSDIEGNFRFGGFAPGKYDLTASFVGYDIYSRPMEFASGQAISLEILLNEAIIELPEVFVNADTTNWRSDFEVFRTRLLGHGPNAKKVEIVGVSPSNLHLYFDHKSSELVAHANEPFKVKNHALGYEIDYQLRYFVANLKTGYSWSFGIPRFSEMTPRSNSQRKRWQKERLKAYKGSLNHFMKSLLADELEKEQFAVQQILRLPNRDKKPQELIERKYAEFIKRLRTKDGKMIARSGSPEWDSLNYWRSQREMPAFLDSLGPTTQSKSDLDFLTFDQLNVPNDLNVIYQGEREDARYITFIRSRAPARFQTTRIAAMEEPLKIYQNGYYEDVTKVVVTGYLAWLAGLAEMLPLDFQASE